MSAILKITFLSAAEVDDTLSFKFYALFPDTGTEFTRGETFKTTRAFPGQCEIGSNAVDQAIKYEEAFTADYLTADFSISREVNEVTITCLNGSEIFDEAINVGATFATFELIPTDVDNMIHEIIFTPRQYATPSGLARNYLITEDDLLILTETGKKIRL
jgi:hypothetical protein